MKICAMSLLERNYKMGQRKRLFSYTEMPQFSNPVFQPDTSINAVVDAVVDAIITQIIRPGPKPEERECTTVAAEIEAMKPQLYLLATIVAKEPK